MHGEYLRADCATMARWGWIRWPVRNTKLLHWWLVYLCYGDNSICFCRWIAMTHAQTNTHGHRRRRRHTHTRTHTQTQTRTQTPDHVHAHKHTHARTHIHTHIYTHIHTHIENTHEDTPWHITYTTSTHTCTHTFTNANEYMHICYKCIRVPLHICIQMCMHTVRNCVSDQQDHNGNDSSVGRVFCCINRTRSVEECYVDSHKLNPKSTIHDIWEQGTSRLSSRQYVIRIQQTLVLKFWS